MGKQDNLNDFLVDLYQSIASKKPDASKNPQDFSREIESIVTGEGGGIDTTDATATPQQILNGATAYVNGSKITGTIPTYDGSHEGGITASGVQIGDVFPEVMEKDVMYGVPNEIKICDIAVPGKVCYLTTLLLFEVGYPMQGPVTSVSEMKLPCVDNIIPVYPYMSTEGFDLGEQYVCTIAENFDPNDILDAYMQGEEPDIYTINENLREEFESKIYASFETEDDALTVDTIQLYGPNRMTDAETIVVNVSPLIKVEDMYGVVVDGMFISVSDMLEEAYIDGGDYPFIDPYTYINNMMGYFIPVTPFDDSPVGVWFKNNTSHINPRWNLYAKLSNGFVVPILPQLNSTTNLLSRTFRKNEMVMYNHTSADGVAQYTYPPGYEEGLKDTFMYFMGFQEYAFMYNGLLYPSSTGLVSTNSYLTIADSVTITPYQTPVEITVDINPVLEVDADIVLPDSTDANMGAIYILRNGTLCRRSVIGSYNLRKDTRFNHEFAFSNLPIKVHFMNENGEIVQYSGVNVTMDYSIDWMGEADWYKITFEHSTDTHRYTSQYHTYINMMGMSDSWTLAYYNLADTTTRQTSTFSWDDVDPRIKQFEIVDNIENNMFRKFIEVYADLTSEPKYVQYAAITEGGAST